MNMHPHAVGLPIFDPDAQRELLRAGRLDVREAAADVPNYRINVEQAVRNWPDAWRNAHTDNARTEDFARLLNSYLHYELDINVGLVGKRLSETDVSDDGVMLKHASGPIVDVKTGERLRFFDVIASAGTPSASPVWQDLSGTTPSAGLWIKPALIHTNVGGPPPPPPPPPPPVKTRAQFEREFIAVNEFYAAPDGLQRVGGMVSGVDASAFKVLELFASGADVDLQAVRNASAAVLNLRCDVQAMIQWGFDLAYTGKLEDVLRAIRASDEWRSKHR